MGKNLILYRLFDTVFSYTLDIMFQKLLNDIIVDMFNITSKELATLCSYILLKILYVTTIDEELKSQGRAVMYTANCSI